MNSGVLVLKPVAVHRQHPPAGDPPQPGILGSAWDWRPRPPNPGPPGAAARPLSAQTS